MRLTIAALMTALAFAVSPARGDTIRVQSTTDTVDAGLVDGLLKPMYQQAQPGDTLQYTAVGTGKALDNARAGLADIVITHAPSLEAQFVADGYSADPFGRQIFYSDYVIVGPKTDPAGVASAHPHDAIGAFEDIAAAGDAGTASFASRGDNSGTNVQEQLMWGLTTTVTKQIAVNAGGNNQRFEPGSGGTYPTWYVKTQKGQAASLQDADVCAAGTYPNGGCYTMLDRGTFNRLLNAGTVTNMKIVSEKNTAGARGGENLLVNPFAAYVLNPDKFAEGSKPNVAAARRFLDFLVSPGFQTAIESFPTAVDPAFRPDAFPAVALDTPLPQTATAGSTVTVAGTVTNRLPGAAAVSGMAVQLQQSTDGSTWSDVGSAASTDASGRFSVSVPIGQTASFRVSTPLFATTSYNGFTAAATALGAVTVPPSGPDTTKPQLSAVNLMRSSLSFNVSEAAIVGVWIERRTVKTVRRKGKRRKVVRYKPAQSFNLLSTGAETLSHSFATLPAGRYRVRLAVEDLASNVGTTMVVNRTLS